MDYEVVVVGAGPAGSTAAKHLSEQGISVLLIDKDKFPRKKACGGGIPVRLLKQFSYLEELIDSYSYTGWVHSSFSKSKVQLQREKPTVAMVVREKFDHDLVKLAVAHGTTFMDGKTVTDLVISKDDATIMLDDESSITSHIVIGADGIWSTIAKKAGLASSRESIGVCAFQEQKLGKATMDQWFKNTRTLHVHLHFQGMSGYGWVFPKKEHLNVGIGEIIPLKQKREGKNNLREKYQQYLVELKKQSLVPPSFGTGRIQGGATPLYPLDKTYADRVILCGDAAGLINPVTAEGIHYAMHSGKIAAEVVGDALVSHNYSDDALSQYQTRWKKQFGKDLKILLKTTTSWTNQTEKLIKLLNKDKKLADMALDVLTGQRSIHECRVELVVRALYVYCIDFLRRGNTDN